jgi:DNA-binding response OmpR family regulator
MSKKILIIDDDPRLMKAYDVKLTGEGFQVVTELDGTKAFDRVLKEKPDLILLDGLMPAKNGWEILDDLKADSELQNIPVIFVSNIGSEDREIDAHNKGAADYLVKSNTPLQELVDKINEILS